MADETEVPTAEASVLSLDVTKPESVVKPKLTLEDLDKAADFYENLIDATILNPSVETVAVLKNCVEALEILGIIRGDIEDKYEEDDTGNAAKDNWDDDGGR